MRFHPVAVTFLLYFGLAWFSNRLAISRDVDFASDVLPILNRHCVACHGAQRQESGYRLDVRQHAFGVADFGMPAIVTGRSADSPLIRYVSGTDEDGIIMPPPGEGRPLTRDEIDVLAAWIDAGAVWPDELAGRSTDWTSKHWSFRPLQPHSPPAIADDWIANPIDAFVLHRLSEIGLEPSKRADRKLLIRRVYLVILGLLPTVDEVEQFVADASPDAYRRLVDRVLCNPRYGERWARHWLDVVRFAETNGFETNRERPTAYHYRDYVINALNTDKAYDQFVKEQICGDSMQADAATGFLVAGPYDLVKSPDINLTLMQRQDELADIVNTTGTTFLGLTLGCARCHTHKFDPIPQRDYYSVQAVFAGVHHGERALPSAHSQAIEKQVERLRNELAAQEVTLGKLRHKAIEIASSKRTHAEQRPPVNSRMNIDEFPPVITQRLRFTVFSTSTGSEPCLDELEVYDVAGNNVALSRRGTVPTASGTLPNYEIHQLRHVNDGAYGNSRSWIADTPRAGWVELQFIKPVAINRVIWGRDRLQQFSDRLATDYLIQVKDHTDHWLTVSSSADREPFSTSVTDEALIRFLDAHDARNARELKINIEEKHTAIERLTQSIAKAWIGTFKEPEPTHRLHRGDPLSKREQVAPGGLTVFGDLKMTVGETDRSRRRRFADWMVGAEVPLTSRVIVNRIWHYHFGRGIVSTPNDLGVNGARPSHPELLDWLATELIRHDWSLKQIHRLILHSATFQQSSKPRATSMAMDAGARLLWRFPPRRLEAEPIRDNILSVAGSLDPRIGGPGFSAFDVEMENVRHYFPRTDWGPKQWRRMVYMTKVRQEQDAVFGNFDCPDGNQSIARRSRSTTPLQALNLLNSGFVLQQSELFAERLKREMGGDVEAQVDRAFKMLTGRGPDGTELQLSIELITQHGLAAFCRAMLNSNEFLFVF